MKQRFAKYVVFLVISAGIGFVSADGRYTKEPINQDIYESALRQLHIVQKSIAQTPTNSLRHDRLRLLHILSAREQQHLLSAQTDLQSATYLDPTVRLAYEGALSVVQAKYTFWPPGKMQHFRKGAALLDSAVAIAPADTEIRYLRLVSCYYLPFFLGRKWSVQEDFKVLAEILPESYHRYTEGWILGVAQFVYNKGELRDPQKEGLEKTLSSLHASVEINREETAPK